MQASNLPTDQFIRFTDAPSMRVVSQRDGRKRDSVRVPVQSSPTGDYGVGVARVALGARTAISGTAEHHMIGIVCSDPVPTEHTIGGKTVRHESGPGCLCICPAGTDHFTAFGGPMHGIVMRVSPECLTLAKADLAVPGAALLERMEGEDPVLTWMAQRLVAEAAAGHPNGMLYWSSLTDSLLRHLTAHHLSATPAPLRAPLNSAALKRLDEYISSNLAAPLDLTSLAAVAGCKRFHFAHLFRAAVGISPHRYIVRRRLQEARALLGAGRGSLAEISAACGFTDQSHLSRWIRRVYGATPRQLAA